MIKVRELVNNDPELLGNNDIMKFVKLALFRASEDEPVQEIAKELDDELSGYLVKVPAGVTKLQETLKSYY